MPRITTTGYSNADVVKEPALFVSQGNKKVTGEQPAPVQESRSRGSLILPEEKLPGGLSDLSGELTEEDKHKLDTAVQEDLEEAETSAGTSSSTSGKKPGWSGSGAQETGQSTQSPAPSAASPSEQDPQANQAPSSTAPLTDGSTRETGQGQESPRDSSAGVTPVVQATPATTEEKKTADEMLHLAREAFDSGDLDMADELLDEADKTDPALAPQIAEARAEIMKVRAEKK